MSLKLSNKTKKGIKYGSLIGLTAFLPIIGLPLACAYFSYKGGKKVGDYFYNNPNRKEVYKTSTKPVKGLENVYLNKNEYDKYFNGSESLAYVNGSNTKKVIRMGKKDEGVLETVHLLSEKVASEGNKEYVNYKTIRTVLNNPSVKFKDKNKVLEGNNLETILNNYVNETEWVKRREENDNNYYFISNNFPQSEAYKWHYFEGNDLKFLNPEENHSSEDSVTLVSLDNTVKTELTPKVLEKLNNVNHELFIDLNGKSINVTPGELNNFIGSNALLPPNISRVVESSA